MFSERTQDLLGEHLSPERVERPMTLDEATALAIALHKQEELGAAEAVYNRILAAVPDHAPALHFAGVLAHQLGRHDEAVQRIEKSLASESGCADWHSNHGLALQGAGRVE